MAKTKPPQPLANSLAGFLRGLGVENKVKEFEVIGKWPSIVGQKVAQATEAERVADGTLFVRVINSAWRHELIYLRSDILTRIEKKVGRGIIKEIRYI